MTHSYAKYTSMEAKYGVTTVYLCPEIETIHLKFCKFVLGVPTSAHNVACYGEFGCSLVVYRRKTWMVKYWLSLHNWDTCTRAFVAEACIQNVTEPELGSLELGTFYRMLVSTVFGKTLGMCTPLK